MRVCTGVYVCIYTHGYIYMYVNWNTLSFGVNRWITLRIFLSEIEKVVMNFIHSLSIFDFHFPHENSTQ